MQHSRINQTQSLVLLFKTKRFPLFIACLPFCNNSAAYYAGSQMQKIGEGHYLYFYVCLPVYLTGSLYVFIYLFCEVVVTRKGICTHVKKPSSTEQKKESQQRHGTLAA